MTPAKNSNLKSLRREPIDVFYFHISLVSYIFLIFLLLRKDFSNTKQEVKEEHTIGSGGNISCKENTITENTTNANSQTIKINALEDTLNDCEQKLKSCENRKPETNQDDIDLFLSRIQRRDEMLPKKKKFKDFDKCIDRIKDIRANGKDSEQ